MLKAEKLLKINNDIELETSLEDDTEEKGFVTDLDSLYLALSTGEFYKNYIGI